MGKIDRIPEVHGTICSISELLWTHSKHQKKKKCGCSFRIIPFGVIQQHLVQQKISPAARLVLGGNSRGWGAGSGFKAPLDIPPALLSQRSLKVRSMKIFSAIKLLGAACLTWGFLPALQKALEMLLNQIFCRANPPQTNLLMLPEYCWAVFLSCLRLLADRQLTEVVLELVAEAGTLRVKKSGYATSVSTPLHKSLKLGHKLYNLARKQQI